MRAPITDNHASKERQLRCLFCKADSSTSRSREHIVPESFGNTEHILEPGVVCDRCNNYLAREVEKPILDSLYFKERRLSAVVPNKRGHVVPLDGSHLQSRTRVQLYAHPGQGISISAHPDAYEKSVIKTLSNLPRGTLIFPVAIPPDERALARFVGKVGLEALAAQVIQAGDSHEELVDLPDLDELRNFVRLGSGPTQWPIAKRQIYPPTKVFSDGHENYQLLHEYQLLLRPVDEANNRYACYISLVLFGEEFVLNIGSPDLDGFEAWREGSDV